MTTKRYLEVLSGIPRILSSFFSSVLILGVKTNVAFCHYNSIFHLQLRFFFLFLLVRWIASRARGQVEAPGTYLYIAAYTITRVSGAVAVHRLARWRGLCTLWVNPETITVWSIDVLINYLLLLGISFARARGRQKLCLTRLPFTTYG